jgi:phenylpropionate dioxygenase-like ring-hydroxylating dioxygenase large terminal subunit
MSAPAALADDATVVQRLLHHIDEGTTDESESTWRELVENYRSEERFAAELAAMRRVPVALCPSAALAEPGAWLARTRLGIPLLGVRGDDGAVRVFRNACRHRGTQLASGAGCTRAFVCPYHGWTYALDGRLRHVPHAHGFPGLDREERGLVALESAEAQGIVFADLGIPGGLDAALAGLPPLVSERHRVLATREQEIPANWKLLVEGFLEGYHIRATHTRTFYPLQYDNVNVVEHFGPNNRVAFPYRAIEKQRHVAPQERSADGVLTYLYHLFPNSVVATFPERRIVAVLEPLAVDRTLQTTTLLSAAPADDATQAFIERGNDLVDAGAAEDREVACAIQRALGSEANEFFEFGRFEGALTHFHRSLRALLGEAA